MKKSALTVVLNYPPQKVWEVMTNNKNYSWRSDLEKIKIVNGTEFKEITKSGFVTHFKITSLIPFSYYSFTMENKNLLGNWKGQLVDLNGQTELTLTEEILVKNFIIKLIAALFFNVKKIQKKYVSDLMEELNKNS